VASDSSGKPSGAARRSGFLVGRRGFFRCRGDAVRGRLGFGRDTVSGALGSAAQSPPLVEFLVAVGANADLLLLEVAGIVGNGPGLGCLMN
jgi:hypothetical protein